MPGLPEAVKAGISATVMAAAGKPALSNTEEKEGREEPTTRPNHDGVTEEARDGRGHKTIRGIPVRLSGGTHVGRAADPFPLLQLT